MLTRRPCLIGRTHDLNQVPLNESLSLGVSHYSVMGSAHPMDNNEDSEVQKGGGHRTPGVMPEWLTQLMTRANDNNSHRALKQFQKMKPQGSVGNGDLGLMMKTLKDCARSESIFN